MGCVWLALCLIFLLFHGFQSHWNTDKRFTLLAHDCVNHPQVTCYVDKALCLCNEDNVLPIRKLLYEFYFFVFLPYTNRRNKMGKMGIKTVFFFFIMFCLIYTRISETYFPHFQSSSTSKTVICCLLLFVRYRMLSQKNYRECLAEGWSNDIPHCEGKQNLIFHSLSN